MDGARDRALVPVATAVDRSEAELIIEFLRSCGVLATLSVDVAAAPVPAMSVLVAAADEATACRFLAEVDDERE